MSKQDEEGICQNSFIGGPKCTQGILSAGKVSSVFRGLPGLGSPRPGPPAQEPELTDPYTHRLETRSVGPQFARPDHAA
jgi:hypothetical protein